MNSSSSKIYLILAGILISVAVLIFFVIRPALSRVSALRAGIQAANVRIVALDARIADLQTARAELQKIERERVQMTALFPPRQDMVVSVEALEAAVYSAGIESELKITDYEEQAAAQRPGEKPKAPLASGLAAVEEVPFTLELVSDYRGLVNFFRYLENSAVLVRFGGLLTTAETDQAEQETEPRNTGRAASKLEGVFFMRK